MKRAPKHDSELFPQLFQKFEARTGDPEPRFEQLFGLFEDAFKDSRRKRVASTPHLDVLQVFGLAEDELRHSRVLSWFLDADAEHEQGAIFTQALLRLVAGKEIPEHTGTAAKEDYIVEREKHKRTDVSVYRRRRFAIFIENKVRHSERIGQVKDMIDELVRLADAERIPIPYRFAVFLTDDPHDPKTGPKNDVAGFERGNLKSLTRVDVFYAFHQALSQRTASPLLTNLLSCYLNAIDRLRRL